MSIPTLPVLVKRLIRKLAPIRLVGEKVDLFCLSQCRLLLTETFIVRDMKRIRKSERKEAFGVATSNTPVCARFPDELSCETPTTPLAKIKVLIVYHACWIRRAMRNVIDQTERFAVCAETDNARGAIALFQQHYPKIVVLDPSLPGGGGLDLIKSLIKLAPAALILVLSWDEGVMSIYRVLRAGAVGYLSVEDGDSELPVALDTVVAGAYYVSKNLWSTVLKSFAHSVLRQIKTGANRLTDRELEVFSLVGRGAGAFEISEKLKVSVKTVETHQMRIRRKLKLASTAELRKYAVHSMSRNATR